MESKLCATVENIITHPDSTKMFKFTTDIIIDRYKLEDGSEYCKINVHDKAFYKSLIKCRKWPNSILCQVFSDRTYAAMMNIVKSGREKFYMKTGIRRADIFFSLQEALITCELAGISIEDVCIAEHEMSMNHNVH